MGTRTYSRRRADGSRYITPAGRVKMYQDMGVAALDIFGNEIPEDVAQPPATQSQGDSIINRLQKATTDEERAGIVGYKPTQQIRQYYAVSSVRGYNTSRTTKIDRFEPDNDQIEQINDEIRNLPKDELLKVLAARMQLIRINHATLSPDPNLGKREQNPYDMPIKLLPKDSKKTEKALNDFIAEYKGMLANIAYFMPAGKNETSKQYEKRMGQLKKNREDAMSLQKSFYLATGFYMPVPDKYRELYNQANVSQNTTRDKESLATFDKQAIPSQVLGN